MHAGSVDDRLLADAGPLRVTHPKAGRQAEVRLLLRLPDGLRPDDDPRQPADRPRGAVDRALSGGAVLAVLPRVRADVPAGDGARAQLGQPSRRRPQLKVPVNDVVNAFQHLPAPVQPRRGVRPDRPLAGLVRARAADRRSRSTPTARCATGCCRRSCSAATCWSRTASGVGGDFKHIPACRSSTQLGCVIAFSTFDQPVPPDSLFGRTTVTGEHVLCVEPGRACRRRGQRRPDLPVGAVRARDADRGGDRAARTSRSRAADRVVRACPAPTAPAARSAGANVLQVTAATGRRCRRRAPTRPGACTCSTPTSSSATCRDRQATRCRRRELFCRLARARRVAGSAAPIAALTVAGRFGTFTYHERSGRCHAAPSEPAAEPIGIVTPRRPRVRPTTRPLTATPPGRPRAAGCRGCSFGARPMDFAIGGHRRFGDVWTMRIPIHHGGVRRHLPSGPLALADEGQARRRAVADRRIAAATAARPQLGADLDRRPSHAPAQAAAAAVSRRGGPALRRDDLRRRRCGDRPLADRHGRSRWRRGCRT